MAETSMELCEKGEGLRESTEELEGVGSGGKLRWSGSGSGRDSGAADAAADGAEEAAEVFGNNI